MPWVERSLVHEGAVERVLGWGRLKGGKLARGTPRKTLEGFTFPLFRKPLILLAWRTPALGTRPRKIVHKIDS